MLATMAALRALKSSVDRRVRQMSSTLALRSSMEVSAVRNVPPARRVSNVSKRERPTPTLPFSTPAYASRVYVYSTSSQMSFHKT